jgi:hypothetical protein
MLGKPPQGDAHGIFSLSYVEEAASLKVARATQEHLPHFVTSGSVSEAGRSGGAGEKATVNQTFQPSARFSAANSL